MKSKAIKMLSCKSFASLLDLLENREKAQNMIGGKIAVYKTKKRWKDVDLENVFYMSSL